MLAQLSKNTVEKCIFLDSGAIAVFRSASMFRSTVSILKLQCPAVTGFLRV